MYNFWIDHLRINISFFSMDFLNDIMEKLDWDNSTEYNLTFMDKNISITKDITSQWTALNINISIENNPQRIFQYFIYNYNTQIQFNTIWWFSIYSTYFRLVEIGKLPEDFYIKFIGKEWNKFSQNWISRIDFKIDFFYSEATNIIKKDRILNRRKWVKNVNYKQWDTKTWRIYWQSKNKSVVIRVYEKNIDTKEKWKIFLYEDYLEYPNVYRLEFEFLNKFTKRNNGKTFSLQELDKLKEKIFQYIWLSKETSNEWYFYQYRRSNYKITENDWKYINDATWRNVNMIKNWINPFEKTVKRCRRDGLSSNKIDSLLERAMVYNREYLKNNTNNEDG